MLELLAMAFEAVWGLRRGPALPPVTGLPLSEARERLAALGYDVMVDRPDSEPADQVVDQRPRAGRRGLRDGVVRLRLAPPPPSGLGVDANTGHR